MARVTEVELKEIFPTDLDDSALTPFIEVATMIVDEELTNKGYTANRLKTIELYLAAHYAVISLESGGIKYEKVSNAATSYNVPMGEGLKSTRYGAQALTLDTAGGLAALASAPLKARLNII